MAFGNPKDAGELLAALEAEPAVESAAIYERNGQLFASYNAKRHAGLTVPSAVMPPGARFEAGALIVARRIVLDEDLLGTVYIRLGLDVSVPCRRRSAGRVARIRQSPGDDGDVGYRGAATACLRAGRLLGIPSRPAAPGGGA